MYSISKSADTPLLLFLLFLLSPLITGCIEVDAQITLNQDGSGKIIVTEILTNEGKNRLAILSKNGKIPNIDITEYFTSRTGEDLAKRITKFSSGIDYNSVKMLKFADGSEGRLTTYTFKDINKVILFNINSGNKENLKFDFNRKTLKIHIKLNKQEKTDIATASVLLSSVPAIIKEAFKGMKINIVLNTEQKFKTTTAHYSNASKNIITFLNVDVGKLIATPEVINTLVSLDKIPEEKRYSYLRPFNRWLKVEIEEAVTVSF